MLNSRWSHLLHLQEVTSSTCEWVSGSHDDECYAFSNMTSLESNVRAPWARSKASAVHYADLHPGRPADAVATTFRPTLMVCSVSIDAHARGETTGRPADAVATTFRPTNSWCAQSPSMHTLEGDNWSPGTCDGQHSPLRIL
jgi:hypothetical protein